MKLTKENVCVFIDNNDKLEKAKEILNKYNQVIDKDCPFIFDEYGKWLKLYTVGQGWYIGNDQRHLFTEITLSELEEILKNEVK